MLHAFQAPNLCSTDDEYSGSLVPDLRYKLWYLEEMPGFSTAQVLPDTLNEVSAVAICSTVRQSIACVWF
jgi:hypothetical protein